MLLSFHKFPSFRGSQAAARRPFRVAVEKTKMLKKLRNFSIYAIFTPFCGENCRFGRYRIPLGKLIFLAAQGAAAFPGSGLVARRRNLGSPDGEKPLRGKGLRARGSGSGVVAGGGAARARKMSKFA